MPETKPVKRIEVKPAPASPSLEQIFSKRIGIAAVAAGLRYQSDTKRRPHTKRV